MKRPRILVCGDSMEDIYWWGEVNRISPEAPVPCVRVEREETRPGAAANVAKNCEALGADVTLVAVQGARKIRVVARNQQVVRVDFDRTECASPELMSIYRDFVAALYKGVDAVILSDYGKGALQESPTLIRCAREHHV